MKIYGNHSHREDHALSRQMLGTPLGHLRHCIVEATNGMTALRFRRVQPDLIISDILMPAERVDRPPAAPKRL